MRLKLKRHRGWVGLLSFLLFAKQYPAPAAPSSQDIIGLTLLQTVTTNLNGSGVHVAQVEAPQSSNDWEVNPGAANVNQPVSLFTYTSSSGNSSTYPNSVGTESTHADTVAVYFYGIPNGVATNLAQVDNYEANYFYSTIIAQPVQINIGDAIVNQSFAFGGLTVVQQQQVDQNYDNDSSRYGTLFVSGAGNGGSVSAPATSYNGIGVGAYLNGVNYSSVGPTVDNGRAKPDITAPSQFTSFSTPQVAGAAAILIQAGKRGDGGADTVSASDNRTIKALLLNGAIKPADWTSVPPSPLDTRYGAGVLNMFNSYEQLAQGKHGYTVAATVPTGTPHPPLNVAGSVATLSGWDFNTNTSSQSNDGVNHYYFDVTNTSGVGSFTATATLVWMRHTNLASINDLDLFLYDVISTNLIASSTSTVDNVEHIYVPSLPQGRYDLQVLKNGGTYGLKRVSNNEAYALAFEFFSMPIQIAPDSTGSGALVTWPIYPTGFNLQSSAVLGPDTAWTVSAATPVVSNFLNQVDFDTTNGAAFFRLERP